MDGEGPDTAVAHDHHTRDVCACGQVIRQCRCAAPKVDVVVAEKCRRCSAPLLVYPAEEALGLGEAIRASAAVRLLAPARHDPARELPEPVRAALHAQAGAALPADLFPLTAVLVSTGMNLNDDFFVGGDADTWAARATPAHKPFNYEHDSADVIGHMTAATPFVYGGEDGTQVLPIDEPREAFHIACSAFLYRYWPDNEAAQKRMDGIVAEVAAGDWSVSMECRFPRFDYALVPVRHGAADVARARVVPRGPDTADMTRALRAYGGTGYYQGYRIARVFRDFAFSAVGLVRTPANPGSVILTHGSAAAGYEPGSDTPKGPSMNDQEAKALKAELEAAKAEALAAKEAATKAAADLAAAKAELDAAKATVKTLEATAAAARAEADTAKAALEKAAEEAKLAARAAKVADAYGVDAEKAKAQALTLAPLPDEAFDAHLKAVAEMKAAAVKSGEAQTVSGRPAPGSQEPKLVKQVAVAAAATADLLAAPPAAAETALATQAPPAEDLVAKAAAEIAEFRAKGKPAKAGKAATK